MPPYSRHLFALLVSLLAFVLAGSASAQPWQSTDPALAGWSVGKLKAAPDYAASLKPTAVMVVQDGKVIASWGDISRKVNVASVRKSLLSTLADLGIDDRPPALTTAEMRATVRDLLMLSGAISCSSL
ncbi:hypothetical protein [Phyllobacterium phragmitis]|uniref:hypothetical protein n=1 Tax=Phyllobacterium phragmitis TaxID=2670329 RepID=UPI001FE1F4FF|nr:hypothetical protein [Phyllobacterium phragmitis]